MNTDAEMSRADHTRGSVAMTPPASRTGAAQRPYTPLLWHNNKKQQQHCVVRQKYISNNHLSIVIGVRTRWHVHANDRLVGRGLLSVRGNNIETTTIGCEVELWRIARHVPRR